MTGLDKVLAAARSDPGSVGLFADFDGTLAEIADDASAAVPAPGVVERVDALARALGRVAIVSGRPVSFLHGFFADDVELSGLYGIEHWAEDRLFVDRSAIDWLPTVAEATTLALSEFGEEFVEPKTYSLTLHYRSAADESDLGERMRGWVRATAARTGLEARIARMSYELHPPIGRTKAHALHDMMRGLTSAVYVGDDRGDRPAFEKMGELVTSGRLAAGASVLVRSEETPAELVPLVTDIFEWPHHFSAVFDALLDVI